MDTDGTVPEAEAEVQLVAPLGAALGHALLQGLRGIRLGGRQGQIKGEAGGSEQKRADRAPRKRKRKPNAGRRGGARIERRIMQQLIYGGWLHAVCCYTREEERRREREKKGKEEVRERSFLSNSILLSFHSPSLAPPRQPPPTLRRMRPDPSTSVQPSSLRASGGSAIASVGEERATRATQRKRLGKLPMPRHHCAAHLPMPEGAPLQWKTCGGRKTGIGDGFWRRWRN